MSTTNIVGYLVTPGGEGIEGALITSELSGTGPPYYYDEKYIIPYEKTSSYTSQTGYFSISLYPNSLLSPSGTCYNITMSRAVSGDSIFFLDGIPVRRTQFTDVIIPESDTQVNIQSILQE